MNMLKNILKATGFATIAIILAASPVLAVTQECLEEKYPNLTTKSNDEKFRVKCPTFVNYNNEYITIYAKTSADCAIAERVATNPSLCGEEVLEEEEKEQETFNSKGTIEYFKPCMGEGKKYPNISTEPSAEYPKKCPLADIKGFGKVQFYVKGLEDCAKGLAMSVGDYGCADVPDTDVIYKFQPCVGKANRKYPNLSLVGPSGEYGVKCPAVAYKDKLVAFFGKSSADCAYTTKVIEDDGNCDPDNVIEAKKRRSLYTIIGSVVGVILIIVMVMISKKNSKKGGNPSTPTTPEKPANPFLPPTSTDNPFLKPAEPTEPLAPATPAEPEAQNYPANQPDNPQNQ